MMRLRDLIAAGQMQYLLDGRKGSLLDYSGKNLGASSITGTPSFRRTARGLGVYVPYAGTNYLSPGNPAGLQLSNGTIFAVAARGESNAAAYQGIFVKWSAYSLFFNTGAENKSFGCYDWGAAAWRASTFSEGPVGRIHMFASTFQSGVANGTAFYVDGLAYGTATMTVANQASSVTVGSSNAAGQGLGGPVLLAGISSRVLSASEIADLYTDWLESSFTQDAGPKMFLGPWQAGMSDSEYSRLGIVLDTDFQRQPGGTMRDLTGNYPGTVTGVVPPGPGGTGARLLSGLAADDISNGDVTQLNSASAFTWEAVVEWPAGNIAIGYCSIKLLDANNYVGFGPIAAAANPKAFDAFVMNGGSGRVRTNDLVLRGGTTQHIMICFNGAGGTNAERLQVFVDGEQYTNLNFISNMPASTPNLAGANYVHYNSAATPRTMIHERLYSRQLSAGDNRAAYLRFAKNVDWQAPGEDMPVSLVASYGTATPNALGGGWLIVSGTWKVSEDSAGRRFIECVTAGAVAIPQTHAFGTWVFTAAYANPAAGIQGTWFQSTDLAGTARYQIYTALSGVGRYFALAKVGVNLFYTPLASPYSCTAIPVEFCVNRRRSDGRFTIYARGRGLSAPWLLLPPDVGFTNPTAGDTNSVTSAYMVLNGQAGDKWMINDPSAPGACFRHYVGVLDPTRGEVG